jgi:hypothetical protein
MNDPVTRTNSIEPLPAQKPLDVGEGRLVRISDQFIFWGGAVLMSLGMAGVVGTFGKSQALEMLDPVFGVPFRDLMFGFGIIQSCVAGLMLFTGKRNLACLLAAWIVANFLVYRIGLWCIGWHHSSGFMFEPLGLSLKATDAIISFISLCLLVGYCTSMGLAHWAAEQSKSAKMFCPACGGHIKFVIENLGQKTACPHCQVSVMLRKDENLKMFCFFCKGHISFPAHAIGTKVPCPHCKMDITLKEQS